MLSIPIRRFVLTAIKDVSGLVQLLLGILSLRKNQPRGYTERRIEKRSLISRLPAGSWDSHMHVIDPVKYPLSKNALYTPQAHTLSEALQFEQSTGIRKIVLVQPSIYGTDNSCLLDALRALGPTRARAVVAFDCEKIDCATLDKWHEWGVRGVRVNTQSIGKHMDEEELATALRRYADIIRAYNWVLQLYVPLATAVVLEKIVPELGVTVCLDHFGSPDLVVGSHGGDPYNLPGFRSLVNLLMQGNTYVKLSAPYRISGEETYKDLEPVAKELLAVAGMSRTVFASDWPHTRFEGLDIKPYMEKLLDWCGDDEDLIQRVFRGNAETLWGIDQ
ncbi:hypothetical protein HK57_00151 [Aspergillus ustus]|uniref:Amidohydrolase-related domain-containing protein n=1 Tax=Aspergillus ustus TaxID=40382 RepID=A0A0C1E5B2_ASPUT|nr:hypothetical protein HK57_00151 [Aspergillus ustus]